MNVSMQNDFITNLNRIFDNHTINKNCVDEAEREAQREKFINRATILRDNGVGDITEQSKITGSFFREFSNAVDKCPSYNHEERLQALSERYAEMRDDLAEMFKDNEDEYYRQMDKLNMAFKGALDSTCLTPIYSFKQPEHEMRAFTQDQEAERIRWEAEAEKKWGESEQYNKNVQTIMANFRENLLRHTNTFYESFIKSIQTNNFDTAFQESMALLKSSETVSYKEISYSDMVHIMDVINNVPTEFDENGTPTKMRYNAADESFRALVKDESIPYSVRKSIADLFSFYIKSEQETDSADEHKGNTV